MGIHKRRKRSAPKHVQNVLSKQIDMYLGKPVYVPEEQVQTADRELDAIDAWDKEHPTGEGSTIERIKRAGKTIEVPCTYQWVRVKNDRGRTLGTFYIKHHDGEVLELFLAPARKGVKPNPYDRSYLSRVSWTPEDARRANESRAEMAHRARMTEDERQGHMNAEINAATNQFEAMLERAKARGVDLDMAREQEYHDEHLEHIKRLWDGSSSAETRASGLDGTAYFAQSGWWEANSVDGQRSTMMIYPSTDLNGDVRFTFRDGGKGFAVRGSLLAPMLLKFRLADFQYVTLEMIGRAIPYVA